MLPIILGRDASGYLAIGAKVHRTGEWRETIFPYPSDLPNIDAYVQAEVHRCNLYFCPTTLRQPKRIKDNIITAYTLWADLDTCPPDSMLVKPTMVLETSTNRYQAFWSLKTSQPALDVEEINRRIAYYHKDEGCDTSGWDLTQYLRIPLTKNWKYFPNAHDVKILYSNFAELTYELSDFDEYPTVEGYAKIEEEMPEISEDLTADDILNSVRSHIHPRFWELYENEPAGTWSNDLWALEQSLFDVGLTDEEVFVVVKESALNKYERDNRPDEDLWKEIIRGKARAGGITLSPPVDDGDPNPEDDGRVHIPHKDILSDEERELCNNRVTFVEDYLKWAESVTDAATQYHEASAFIVLSSILSGSLRLPTSFGIIKPNLWLMITGDTTLTRKSTAMDMAVDMIQDVDEDALLATDSSIEGMMQAMTTRPGRPAVFHRDEFSGFLEAMAKRDYYAGMMETMTKLYDGRTQKRVLRSETIHVKDPVFILYTGGIRDRIYQWITLEHISSGFMPRFIFVSADSDISKTRPLGPPTEENLLERGELVSRLRGIYNHYAPNELPSNNGHDGTISFDRSWTVELTDDAWVRYNKADYTLQSMGLASDSKDLVLPMMSRLSISGLKAAMLLAATERLGDTVLVTENDIIHAFSYIEKWLEYSIAVIANAGKSADEKLLERIYKFIRNENHGVSQSKVMRRFHLTSKDGVAVFTTLEQRGLVTSTKRGNQKHFYASTKFSKDEDVKLPAD